MWTLGFNACAVKFKEGEIGFDMNSTEKELVSFFDVEQVSLPQKNRQWCQGDCKYYRLLAVMGYH